MAINAERNYLRSGNFNKMSHICVLKATKFQAWTIISKSQLANLLSNWDFFFVGVRNVRNILNSTFWYLFIIFCLNVSENEANLLISYHIPFLRALTRKFQNDHEFWTHVSRTICIYYTALQKKKFEEHNWWVWSFSMFFLAAESKFEIPFILHV